MKKYLLDTSVLWELLSHDPNIHVQNWMRKQNESELYLSTICLGELQKSISSMAGSKKKKDLELWLLELIERFKERLISIDLETSLLWGKIRSKYKEINPIQALILSTAIQNHFVLVKCKDWGIDCTEVEIWDISADET